MALDTQIDDSELQEAVRELDQLIPRLMQGIKFWMIEGGSAIQRSVPPYPAQLPGMRYKRTGRLGRSLGATMTGKPTGRPDIFKVVEAGTAQVVFEFGSRVTYAPKVVGAPGVQEHPFTAYWWNILGVKERAEPEVIKSFEQWLAKAIPRYARTWNFVE